MSQTWLVICLLFFVIHYAVAQDDTLVAEVNGIRILERDLNDAIQPQLRQLEEQERHLRKAVLHKLIDNVLIFEAARDAELDVNTFVGRHLAGITVSDEEVEREYSKNREKFTGALEVEAKYRIRRSLEDHRRAEAFRKLSAGLRASASIKDYSNGFDAEQLQAIVKDAPIRGRENAPLSIVAFSDYQCPFCRQANVELKRLLELHPTQLRVTIVHFPLERHRLARQASIAAACAQQNEETYWEYHDNLYSLGGSATVDDLLNLAAGHGHDREQFAACLSDGGRNEKLAVDVANAKKLGVDRTPYFFLGDQRFVSIDQLKQFLTSELTK